MSRCQVNSLGNSHYTLYELPDFMTGPECDEIIRIAQHVGLSPSEVYGAAKDVVDDGSRKSYTAWIPDGASPLVRKISVLTSQLTGLPIRNQEDLQVLRYPDGGFFSPHYDCCEGDENECRRMNGNSGPRCITLIIYLNDNFEGGETVFPHLNISIKPQKGKAAVFWSTDENNVILRDAFHGGSPVSKGEKWICNKWIHIHPYK